MNGLVLDGIVTISQSNHKTRFFTWGCGAKSMKEANKLDMKSLIIMTGRDMLNS
jgi:hypothetical protein